MAHNILNEYEPSEISHPGESLSDILEDRRLSQSELAARTGRPIKTINEIVKGKSSVTPETAIQLERVLGVPASFWIKRQYQYDEHIARKNEAHFLERFSDWLKNFPITDMVRNRFFPKGENKRELLQNLLNFFSTATPEVFEKKYRSEAVLYRKSAQFEADFYALAAWLQQGRIAARNIHCKPYDRKSFKANLRGIRRLTMLPPEEFVPRLQDACASCGVAVVFVPELPKMRAYGATHWIGNRPIIQLCLRGRKDDVLWFTFFHEAAHVILHHKKKTIYLDVDKREGKEEEDANHFASELLLPKKELDEFVSNNRLSTTNIIAFAERKGIAPSIIVGKLHHFGYSPYNHFQNLRKTLVWKK